MLTCLSPISEKKLHCSTFTLTLPQLNICLKMYTPVYNVIDTPSELATKPLHTLALGNCMSLPGHSVHGRLCSFLCRKTLEKFFYFYFFKPLQTLFRLNNLSQIQGVMSKMFTFCSNRKVVDEPGCPSHLTQININAVIDLSEEVRMSRWWASVAFLVLWLRRWTCHNWLYIA